ncbi:HK97 gp10 family phage protein [Pseudochrobactrum sp. Wa41.01b-1]|uniref:HK97 gp10 family phage protein n=1 Tax=Pseudochrobactrum sp. Wa41.01b-1 TaxID=2864102 RepID=UPI001C68936B|nr:HK97 gp10 family phage protein [Pseudochrobactrum sp. Wa41.01b-1]QYM73369.1 HK97 gp10 family phage protein [Pseudochrobactrum sp. Wa41.01b-1]
MVQQNFAAQVDAFVMQTQRRMLAAFRTAAQFVIEDMIDRVPVDTGFLRASVVVSLDGSRPLDRPLPAGSKRKQYELNPQYTLAIAGTEIGNTIWASFTANYGAHVEYGTNGRQGRGIANRSVTGSFTKRGRALHVALVLKHFSPTAALQAPSPKRRAQ